MVHIDLSSEIFQNRMGVIWNISFRLVFFKTHHKPLPFVKVLNPFQVLKVLFSNQIFIRNWCFEMRLYSTEPWSFSKVILTQWTSASAVIQQKQKHLPYIVFSAYCINHIVGHKLAIWDSVSNFSYWSPELTQKKSSNQEIKPERAKEHTSKYNE